MTLEFELPLISLLFLILLIVVYISKKKVNITENKLYYTILASTFISTVCDTILHFNGAMHSYDEIIAKYLPLANVLNKIIVSSYIVIFSCLFMYILLITYNDLKKKFNKLISYGIIVDVFLIFILLFTKIEPIKVGGVTNVQGSTSTYGYMIIGIFIAISILITMINLKKIDKRYFVILILPILFTISAILTLEFPGIILYDVIMVMLCYIMYFTIENPDLKMLKQMEIAKDQADKANKAKSDFLSSMSHEIRTPLNAIVGLSEDISTYKDKVPKEVLEDSEDIMNASNTLLEIIGNILDINKIESEKMEIVNVNYNIKEEINSLAKINATRIGDKDIKFTTNFSKDLPYEVIGDRTHIKQIVNNLLSNSIKYTDKGSINLIVNCQNIEDISNITIIVKDTGKGIKEEDINKLFTKFERLDIEKNSTIEGTGLGLAITKSLVEMMGGTIKIDSTYEKGSTFTVNIAQKIGKLISSNNSDDFDDEINTVSDYGHKKILIVDDNTLNIKVAKRALKDFDFEIDEVYDGEEALEKVIIGNEYDLILMDIMMHKMGGIEAIKKLKENPDFKIPTIALTADAVAGAKEKYQSYGFVDYIAKPFTKEQIQEKLDIIFNDKSTL